MSSPARTSFVASLLFVSSLSLALAPAARACEKPAPERKPRVEVVFVLDTTGSMGGLIEGAKKKIWSIANEIVRGQPKPEVHVGLVAYRDKGDEYVTKVIGLTDNLDGIYAELTQLRAGGGGDGPENVRQGLQDALAKIQWSTDKETVRIAFLVGDAPPHFDYQDVATVEEICASAVKAGIIVNTVRCGGDEETGRTWRDIARRTEGRFFSIDQTGGVVAIATPFDEELGKLNDSLGRTFVAFGDERERKSAEGEETRAAAAPCEAKADRACGKAIAGRYRADDLVDAVREKRVDLAKLDDAKLPDELKGKSLDERKAFVEKRAREREDVRAKIVELAKKRDAFVADELKKRGAGRDSFDKVVVEALHEQCKAKGIAFESK